MAYSSPCPAGSPLHRTLILLLALFLGACGMLVTFPTASRATAGDVRVNAGGPSLVDAQGQTWSADTGYTGGAVQSTTSAISGGGNQKMLQTARYGMPGYVATVPLPGTYTVSLYFDETYFRAAGRRVFSVYAQGTKVISNLDIYAAAGGYAQLKKTFDVPVTASTINLTFNASVNNPVISGIEITGPGSGPLPTPPAPPPTATATVTCGYGTFAAGRWPTGCWRPFGGASPFNLPVPASPPVLASSARMVAQMLRLARIANPYAGAADTPSDWYDPVYWSQPSDPIYTVHCTRSWGVCSVEGAQIRIPGPARPSGSADAHLSVIDQASGWEYDFWQASKPGAAGGALTVSWGGRTSIGGDGLGSGASAAGQGLAGGLIRAAELAAGHIDHALAMSVRCTAAGPVYPAHGDAAICPDPTDAPPTGQRFYLAMTDPEIAALPAPAWKKTVLTALAHYGVYITDTGGNISLVAFESGSSYTSFGRPDPLVAFAQQNPSPAIVPDHELYYYDLASGVDWAGRLRALAPPTP
jgi:hypothetical protein